MRLKFGANPLAAAMMIAAAGVGVPAAPAPEEPPKPKPRGRRYNIHDSVRDMFFGNTVDATPIESPKPLGKRARRRLRGRLKQEKRNGKA